jgi:hypothetical protein
LPWEDSLETSSSIPYLILVQEPGEAPLRGTLMTTDTIMGIMNTGMGMRDIAMTHSK